MSDRNPRQEANAAAHDRREESLLRGGITGMALVTAATLGLALVAGLIALIVSLLYS